MRIWLRDDYKSFPMILRLFSDLLCSFIRLLVDLVSGTLKVIEKLSRETVSQEEALENFKWKVERDHEIKEKDCLDDLYGFMYDTDDDASISGKSCEHFSWDWDSPVHNNVQQEVAGEIVLYPPIDEDVAEEMMNNDEERRPSKRIRVTQEEIVKDEKLKKGCKDQLVLLVFGS
ncbi:hypothetical protein Tco_1122265 [Tanacetum coccineum]|uniref:Uncharacterized protein n=1 Tax=Tanacetum coccineum TaxID=301880 RepID=A0ABQ5J044_9ASTR